MVSRLVLWTACRYESWADQCCSKGTSKSMQLPSGQTYMLQS